MSPSQKPSADLHGPVVIAVIAMRMVQATVHEIVDMVTMLHRFMSAMRTVHVFAVDLGRALRGICRADCEDMLVDVIAVHMVEMPIVQIIHMSIMADRRVPAIRAMLMPMIQVMFLGTAFHWRCSLRVPGRPRPSIQRWR